MNISKNHKILILISSLVVFVLIAFYFVNGPSNDSNGAGNGKQKPNISISYSEPTIEGLAIDKCKIKEVSEERRKFGDLASGFPFVKRFNSFPKEIKMAVIPLDFSDLPGDANIEPRVQDQMTLMSEWYQQVSGGRFKVTWQLQKDWVRLPGKSTDYAVPYSGAYPETINFWKKVMPVVDKQVDLAGVQTINFILPSNQSVIKESVQGFPYGRSEMQITNSKQTKLISFTTAGEYFDVPGKAYWSYWAHEFGHVIGFAHVGSSRGESQAMNGQDLLGNQDGPYRELSGWLRFIIGWLDDSQVYCQDPLNVSENKISLIPLSNDEPGIKLVVIPTSKTSAILIDSRRQTKFSCTGIQMPTGVFIYKYDAKLGNQSYFLKTAVQDDRQRYLKCPGNTDMEDYPDVLLHKGEKLSVDNFEISILESANIDQISIKKLS